MTRPGKHLDDANRRTNEHLIWDLSRLDRVAFGWSVMLALPILALLVPSG